MGLILITHDLRVAFSMCDRLYVLYAGSVLEVGPTRRVEDEPLHPYTLGLLLSEPPADRRLKVMPAIAGGVPEPDAVSGSCRFAARCRWADERCSARAPDLAPVEPDRATACVRIDEIRAELRAVRRAEHAIADEPGTPRAASAFVQVEDLTKVFASGSGTRRHTVRALDRVTLAFDAGESVGLVGESGSGKTTLGRCLVGLETPSEGRLVIDGVNAADYSRLTDRDRRRLRRTIQMIFQDPYSSLNPTRTVGATLQEALAAADDKHGSGRAAVEDLLTRVGLPAAYAARKPVALSGGERQRVAIARALAVRPRVIVCDEPVSALDVSVQAQILNLLAALHRELGVSYLFITHDLAVVRQVVERVFVLYRGEIVEHGPVADVLDRPTHPYTTRLVRSVPTTEPGWLES
jgi:peptide/nickel transport system ATP-binding protein